jgi:predicted phage baseplate assembly protein
MTLVTPNLDDRRFQDLVDDAKRLVQQKCPEWTDHNVSDPGVTLIELFAWMTDQLLYRLNRVPDRHYVKFLELVGVKLFPPTAARADVTFWLSAPREEVVRVPLDTQVATVRSAGHEPIIFATTEELAIVPCSMTRVRTGPADGETLDQTQNLGKADGFFCFDTPPVPGNVLLIGLSEAVPSCAVALRVECRIEGVGVDPLDPPLEWEAWCGGGWRRCEVDSDQTGGLNRTGDVVLHIPKGHETSVISNRRAGWIRCRTVQPAEGQPPYSESPRILTLSAFTVGGTVDACHGETVRDEILGMSAGVPGERFMLSRRPVVPSEQALVLEESTEGGWVEWQEVAGFESSTQDDRHFVIDASAGEVVLGPAVREPDGSLRRYGATPAKGASLRLRAYRTGGGRPGNVATGALTVLKSSIPYVARVGNRSAARGGVDGEDVANAKIRGPMVLRSGDRAVTAEDFEHLARSAAPELARVRCVPAGRGADEGAIRVLLVPSVEDERGRIRFEQLIPEDSTLERVTRYLDERRVVGTRLSVEPAVYQGLTVVARLRVRNQSQADHVEAEALESLFRYFHPITGGRDHRGWPFGRPVLVGEAYSVLQRVPGVELIEDARLFAADPVTGERGQAVERIEVDPNAIVFSFDHQVLAQEAPV